VGGAGKREKVTFGHQVRIIKVKRIWSQKGKQSEGEPQKGHGPQLPPAEESGEGASPKRHEMGGGPCVPPETRKRECGGNSRPVIVVVLICHGRCFFVHLKVWGEGGDVMAYPKKQRGCASRSTL